MAESMVDGTISTFSDLLRYLNVLRLCVGILFDEVLEVVERSGHLVLLKRKLPLLRLLFFHLLRHHPRQHSQQGE